MRSCFMLPTCRITRLEAQLFRVTSSAVSVPPDKDGFWPAPLLAQTVFFAQTFFFLAQTHRKRKRTGTGTRIRRTPSAGPPKISLLLSPFLLPISFFLLSGGLLVGLWSRFKAVDHQKSAAWLSWGYCGRPRQERKTKANMGAGEGKNKREILGPLLPVWAKKRLGQAVAARLPNNSQVHHRAACARGFWA